MDTSLSQAVVDSQAREAIMDLFPNIPPRDLHEIVSRAFDMVSQLRSGCLQNLILSRIQEMSVLLKTPP